MAKTIYWYENWSKKKAKNDFEKYFFKLMNNADFGKNHCFIVYIKTDDFYKDIAEYVETRFDTSNYQLDRPLPKGKKVIGLMKDELGEKVMTKIVGLRAKTYSYLTDDGSEATQLQHKINYIEKRKLTLIVLKNS